MNFNSIIPVNAIRVKSYVDSFLDPACVPVRVSINKVNHVTDRIVPACVIFCRLRSKHTRHRGGFQHNNLIAKHHLSTYYITLLSPYE